MVFGRKEQQHQQQHKTKQQQHYRDQQNPTHQQKEKHENKFQNVENETNTNILYYDQSGILSGGVGYCLTQLPFIQFPFEKKSSWKNIQNYLQNKTIKNVEDLKETIGTIQEIVYEGQRGNKEDFLISSSSFTQFDILFQEDEICEVWEGKDNFFTKIIPFLQNLVLLSPIILSEKFTKFPKTTIQQQEGNLPFLVQMNQLYFKNRNQQFKLIKLSKLECICLLANAFFCTFNRMGEQRWKDGMLFLPSVNFDSLYLNFYKSSTHKLLMIIHYFERIFEDLNVNEISLDILQNNQLLNQSYIYIIRKCIFEENFPNLINSNLEFSKINISKEGVIEDAKDALQADFANKYIGGGVLRGGCVQEEIRFCENPELLVTRLFCEEMKDNEAILMVGSEQFSLHGGYGSSTVFKEDFKDFNFEWDQYQQGKQFNTQIIAFDSLLYNEQKMKLKQWRKEFVDREIMKAYAAFCDVPEYFNIPNLQKVSTGNWGCGAFGSDKQLKAIIQYIAATLSGKELLYYTFNEEELTNNFNNFAKIILEKKITVGQVYKILIGMYDNYIVQNENNSDFKPQTFAYILSKL
ncbi:hypothetical protein ABK040_006864 [Willaertia magna]